MGRWKRQHQVQNSQALICKKLGALKMPGGAFITWAILDILESIRFVKLYCLFRQSSWERYPLTVILLVRFGILAEFRIAKSVSMLVVQMAGNDVTLARLRGLIRPPAIGGVVGATTCTAVPARLALLSTARATTPPVGPTPGTRDTPEEGSSNGGEINDEATLDISFTDRNLEQSQPPPSPKKTFIAGRLDGC
ncbi:hypothetical protein PIB30_022498 [Stylosanthes scabra]|uniref:Uncharacterized protein n=1 Tax=Stylosanthes scabra TaxID=79078 RepID=A0ABU6U867_9FABA|nr:hypothetical protein [Stylosanthes scabra]